MRIIVNAAVGIISIVLCYAAAELVARRMFQYALAPSHWDRDSDGPFGTRIKPNSRLQHSNRIDFATDTLANSQGFLDREWPADLSQYKHRVLLIGDSMIEAAQVGIAEKMQLQIERYLSEHGVGSVRVQGMGFSGMGPPSTIQMYEKVGRNFHPTTVILSLVSNDIANSHPLMESVRNGSCYDHQPWGSYQRRNGKLELVNFDPLWTTCHVPVDDKSAPQTSSPLHNYLSERSVLYGALMARISSTSSTNSYQQLLADRLSYLKEHGFSEELSGWDYPNDLDPDNLCFAINPPAVYQEALARLDKALEEYQNFAKRDGFNLVILGTHSLYVLPVSDAPQNRPVAESACFEKIKGLADKRGIPVISAIQGDDLKIVHSLHFSADFHLNAAGHRHVAKRIGEYLLNSGAF